MDAAVICTEVHNLAKIGHDLNCMRCMGNYRHFLAKVGQQCSSWRVIAHNICTLRRLRRRSHTISLEYRRVAKIQCTFTALRENRKDFVSGSFHFEQTSCENQWMPPIRWPTSGFKKRGLSYLALIFRSLELNLHPLSSAQGKNLADVADVVHLFQAIEPKHLL